MEPRSQSAHPSPKEISIEDILNRIDQADDAEISLIIHRLQERYRRVFPNEEVVFLSVPKHDTKERKRIMEAIFSLLDAPE